MSLQVVILTATDQTRFQSKTLKHLHHLAGYPIFNYTLNLAQQLSPTSPIILVHPGLTSIYTEFTDGNTRIIQLAGGQGHWSALVEMQSVVNIQDDAVLVLHADNPLLQVESLRKLIELHSNDPRSLTFLAGDLQNDSEELQTMCNKESDQLSSQFNFAPFIVNTKILSSAFIRALLKKRFVDQTLHKVINIARQYDIKVNKQPPETSTETLTIQTRADYALAQIIMHKRINTKFMRNGISFIDPATAYIDYQVIIGSDTVIYPNTSITGKSSIGEDCHIGPNAIIDSCEIGDRCRVFTSVLESAVMEHDTDIGPFSHLRKGSHVCAHAHIGNFGEMKNSTLGSGAKMGHFSYLGDTCVGAEANIGAGTITCNFDGKDKHSTSIGENTFIGSGTLIVAPRNIGEHAITGAGSVITHDVPASTLVYGVPARVKKKDDSEDAP
jgi:bifunctional UDP-N-acetylglucosamine pyrophosphorylase/glucosamine-1-phosphate N-acetyltransferase